MQFLTQQLIITQKLTDLSVVYIIKQWFSEYKFDKKVTIKICLSISQKFGYANLNGNCSPEAKILFFL
jgi:hypothetical protein